MERTYQERVIEAVKQAKTYKEQYNVVEEIVNEMLQEEDWAINVTRTWKSYGTWSIRLWVNTSHFGQELAESLKTVSIITHDEDKEFTPADLAEYIMENVQEWAYLEAENL